jgi:hypothetical protein
VAPSLFLEIFQADHFILLNRLGRHDRPAFRLLRSLVARENSNFADRLRIFTSTKYRVSQGFWAGHDKPCDLRHAANWGFPSRVFRLLCVPSRAGRQLNQPLSCIFDNPVEYLGIDIGR